MSAFRSPWKDIDDTRPGTPYVVTNDGWGWFFIVILAAVPFLMVGRVIYQISEWICEHPIFSSAIYGIVSVLFGIIFYSRSSMRHRLCGVIAAVISILPFGMGMGLYAIPSVMLKGTISSFFDWALVAAFLFGIVFFIFSVCNILRNGLTHLVIGVVFFAFVSFLIMGCILPGSKILSLESIKQLYGF